MNKTGTWIFVGIFLAYFFFTSGFYYWASGCEETAKLITPYSFALSANERGFAGVTTKSDMDCVQWLLKESNPNFKISGDINAIYLLVGYFAVNDPVTLKLLPLGKFYGMGHCYLLLTQQNIHNGVFILTADVGLRVRYPFVIIPDAITYEVFDETQPNRKIARDVAIHEVYRSGDSVVFEKVE